MAQEIPRLSVTTDRKPVDRMTIEDYDQSNKSIRDDAALSRLGKKQVLKRNFGFMSILGFSCTVLITWESIVTVFDRGLSNGGQAGVVYGYLVVWIGTFSTFVTLSELASMAPTSGGQYHWVAMLAPKSSQRFLSYITGWLTVVGWQAVVASGGLLVGTMIQGLVVMCSHTYNPQPWHGTFLLWATVLFSGLINSVVSNILAKFEGFILILHLIGFFGVLIPLVYLGPHDSAHTVFTVFKNEGGWPTQGLSFWVGIVGNVFAFFGGDGAVHMSEEIQNAQVVVPRSILTSIAINGCLGFAVILALLFCLGDIDKALSTPTQYPFMEVFLQAVQSIPGAAIMSAIAIVMSACATVGCLASASRLLWSFSRDRAMPGWQFLQKVDSRTLVPFPAVATTVITACLLAIINIGSEAAFRQIISLTVGAIFGSYLVVTTLLLWRRCKGHISDKAPLDRSLINVPGAPLVWGPWRLYGWLGTANNIFACVYVVLILFFSFWPAATPVEAATMNYSCLMLGGVMIFSVIYYALWAHRSYKGPVVEIRH